MPSSRLVGDVDRTGRHLRRSGMRDRPRTSRRRREGDVDDDDVAVAATAVGLANHVVDRVQTTDLLLSRGSATSPVGRRDRP